ncbi:MAG: EamA family transporter [Anaerolineales bacterium]|nr:EamA family transporter [Anaerolineales bacterium]
MTFSSLTLLLGSALLHVVAHVALKRARDRASFVWWMLLWGGLLYAPVVFLVRQAIPPGAWAILAVSAVFEALYFAAIAQAYRHGDLSLVYPLARGTAPLFLLIWSALFLAERLSWAGAGGVVLIAFGLYLINLPSLAAWRQPLRAWRQPAPWLALAAGLCVSCYTAIDRAGIRRVEPLLYTYLALLVTTLFLTPYTLRAVGWAGLWAELRSSRFSSVAAGFTTLAAYTLVLRAMQAGVPAGYAGAVREISVVFGAGVGVWLLKERGSLMRVMGAASVAAGVAVIALAG